MNIDPLRKRDLPNPEAMLAQILSDVDAEHRVEELEESGRQGHRWLRVVAAAAAAVVIGGVGWTVTQPAVQQAGPGGQPVPTTPPTPTPTPSPERTVVTQPLPSMRTTSAPQRRTPVATPSPTATSPTTPTPSPTPTPGETPTATPTAGKPTIEPPRVSVTEARRTGTSRPGFDVAVVNAQACPGSLGARIRGPWVEGATALSGEGMLTADGTLVNRNTCIPMGLEVEVPADEPITVTIWVDLQYAAGTAEEVNNGPHEGSAIIK